MYPGIKKIKKFEAEMNSEGICDDVVIEVPVILDVSLKVIVVGQIMVGVDIRSLLVVQ